MIGNRLALSAEESVRQAVLDGVDDEIALDALAQLASNPVGKEAGYGIEENYPLISENLSSRFNISGAIATEYVSRLREYGAQFLLSVADPVLVRSRILEELKTENGRKWRLGMAKRLAKAPTETKRLVYLITVLRSRGLRIRTFESSLAQLQTFHAAAFEKPFNVPERLQSLVDVGLLNRVLYTNSDSRKENIHAVNALFFAEPLGLNAENLKIQTESKQYVPHMFDKKSFDQLRILDEISRESFGIKSFEAGPAGFAPEKKISGVYEDYAAISPFMLDEIRSDLYSVKERRLEEYESRIETAIVKVISSSLELCKIDSIPMPGQQALWRLDNETDPGLYVYLANWTNDEDSNLVLSKFQVPNATSVIAVVLNQRPEGASQALKDKFGSCQQLTLIYPANQKEAKTEMIIGAKTPFSSKFADAITKSLNLSFQLSNLIEREDSEKGDIHVADQFGERPEGLRIPVGSQETKEVCWVPLRERNWNVGVFGDMQTGKTQAIKLLLLDFRKHKIPFLVLDSTGEYLPKEGAVSEFGTVIGASEISVNPLELSGDSPSESQHRLLQSFEAIFGMKDWEVAYLGSAIANSYAKCGITEDDENTWRNEPPTLTDVRAAFDQISESGKGHAKSSVKEILDKIGAVLEHPMFSQPKSKIPFEKLVMGPVVFNLKGLQTDALRAAAIEFISAKIPHFTENKSGELKTFVVIDCAQRLLAKGSPSLQLLKEARLKGIGLIYSCQSPLTLSESTFGYTGAIFMFKTDPKNAKTLLEYLGVKDHQALSKWLSEKSHAIAKFSSEPNITRLQALDYSQRLF